MAFPGGSPQVLSEQEILRIVPNLPYRSSRELYWPGVEVHRYQIPAGESQEHSFPQLTVFLVHSEPAINIDVSVGGAKISFKAGKDYVSVVPPDLPHSGRRDQAGELTAIFLSPALTTEIAVSFTGVEDPEIAPQFGIRDPLIRAIGESLDAELWASKPSPKAYIESLAMTLGGHIIAKYAKPVFAGFHPMALSGTQLRRSIEFMKENLDKDLSLEDLASAATMSKYHFAKSFKLAMGVAPHQYLVRLRVEKARRLLALDTMSVEEIANHVGYADKSHFAEQFRKCTGVSPSHYRKLK